MQKDIYKDYKKTNISKHIRRFHPNLLKNKFFLHYANNRVKTLTVLAKNKKLKILDVGAGTGLFSYLLAKKIKNCKIMDLEYSQFFFKMNINKNKRLGNAEKMPFKDNSFDLVYCIDVLHHVGNIERAISEMKRVSKKTIVFFEPNLYNPAQFLWSAIAKEERGLFRMPIFRIKKLIKKYDLEIQSFRFVEFFPYFLPVMNRFTLPLFKFIEIFTNVPVIKYFSGSFEIVIKK